MEKKLLLYFGGNNPNTKKLILPEWIPTSKIAWIQSVNRVNHKIANEINPFKNVIACETIEDILKIKNNKNSFEDVTFDRALDIKNKTKNSKVYLMYSGGIDSTTALVSMINSWPKEDLKRLHILMSYRSIEEFPDMWKDINKIFKGRIINSLTNTDKFLDDGYIITGELGDQVFGSDVIIPLVDLFGEDAINLPWKNNMNIFYKTFFNSNFKPKVDLFVEKYSMTLPYCPFEIKTCFDFVWWFSFTNKWQMVKYRHLAQKRLNNPKESFEKIIHFFDTPKFQRWSLDNHDKKIKNELSTYKYTAKEFIVKYTKHTDYLNKPKIGSLQFIWSNFDKNYAIDENFNEMSYEEVIGCVNNDYRN
jgi:hypothetical protein